MHGVVPMLIGASYGVTHILTATFVAISVRSLHKACKALVSLHRARGKTYLEAS